MERITGSGSLKRYFNSEYIGAYSIDQGIEPVLTIQQSVVRRGYIGTGQKRTSCSN